MWAITSNTTGVPGAFGISALRRAASGLVFVVLVMDAPMSQAADATVAIRPEARHQTILGWSGMPWYPKVSTEVRDHVLDEAVADLGLTWLHRTVPSGNRTDGRAWEWTNDDADPLHIRWPAFGTGVVDRSVRTWVLPFRERVEARGDRFGLAITQTFHNGGSTGRVPDWLLASPAEFAEYATSLLVYLKKNHGLEADYYVICEDAGDSQDNPFEAPVVAEMIRALGPRLRALGLSTKVLFPECHDANTCWRFIQAVRDDDELWRLVGMLGYHLYGGHSRNTDRPKIRQFAVAKRLPIGHAGSDGVNLDTLYEDLTLGDVSYWSIVGLAGPQPGGAFHLHLDNASFSRGARYWQYRFVPVHGQVTVYDGVEPICRLLKAPLTPGEKGALFISWVKLKPGYRPAYYTWIGPGIREGVPYVLPLVGELPDAFKVEKIGEALAFRFQTNRPDTAKADHVCTIRYDAQRGVYRYEFRTHVAFTLTKPFQLNAFELIDPLTYNNRQAGPEVLHRWNWAEHRWHVFEGAGRTWERYPLIDYLREYGNPPAYWGKFTNFLYPDPGASPAFEVELGWKQQPNRELQLGLCHWGYDFHHAEAGHGGVIEPGTTRDYAVTLTAMPPAEAEALYKTSVVAPKVAASKERYANFDPKGCTFAVHSTRPEPTSTMVWTDGTIDETVGRKDSCSLRIDGPGIGKVQMYQYAVEQNATQWWVRGWTKSKAVAGRGLQLRVKYSYAPGPEQVFYLDSRGDRDWTYFSCVTDVLKQRDCTDISLELDGSGQVWIDDVAVSALTDGSVPKQTEFPLPTELKPSTERLIDLAMSERPGSGVYDASHNGHHLMLASGPQWVQEEGRGFLRLDGVDDYGTIPLKPGLEPLDYQAPQGLIKCLFPLKAFTYEFWARPQAPLEKSGTMTLFHFRFNPVVRFDQFKADGTCRLCFQNDRRRPEDTWIASGQARIETRVPVGQWLHLVATHADGTTMLYVSRPCVGEDVGTDVGEQLRLL